MLGTPGTLRDRLVAAVLAGEKTATTSLRAEHLDDALPAVGQRFRVVDSAERGVAIVEVSAVSTMALGNATSDLAAAEGEGFASIAEWRAGHEAFWAADDYVRELGIVIDDDTEIVAVFFRVVTR